MLSLAPPTCRPAIVDTTATDVGLYLAGLASERDTAARLEIGTAAFRGLLRELSLSRSNMMPIAVDDDLATHFLDMKGDAFDTPTFEETVDRAAGEGRSRAAFRLPAHAILASGAPDAAPQGVIVHVGRCGSTLLCNLLASGSEWVALREPEFLNSLFLARAAAREPAQIDRIETLATRLMGCCAQAMRPRKTIVKLSSWAAAGAAPLLARLPGTRFIVVVRDPWKTVASFLAEPPHWYGACPTGRTRREKERAAAVQLFASAWQSTIRAACRLPAERTLFLHYDEIAGDPVSALAKVLHHLGDGNPIADPAAVARVMGSYSKAGAAEPFCPRRRHRRAPLEDELANIVTETAGNDWRACLDRRRG